VIRLGPSGRAFAVVAAVVAATACAKAPTPAALPAEIAVIHTSSRVTSFVMAKTQPLAATVSQDHKLRIIALPGGAERRVIDIAGRDVDVIAMPPDGQRVAIGDHKGGVSVWDTSTGESRVELHLAHYPGVAGFSHNGAILAIASQGDPVQLIDISSGRPLAILGNPTGGTGTLAFSRDDRFIATGDGDVVVRVYDAHSGQRTSENRDFLLVPLAVEFTADGRSVIAGSGDKVVLFIVAATGKTIRRLDRTAEPAQYLEVSPDGTSFTTAYMKAENMTIPDHVVIRTTASGQPQLDWLPPTLPVGAGWTADGRMLVATATSNALHIWRLR
jgi:WD40 repeat protein